MNRSAFATASILALAACQHPTTTPAPPASAPASSSTSAPAPATAVSPPAAAPAARVTTSPGKTDAPVKIDTTVNAAAGTARVQLLFSQDAANVVVGVRGLDGLQVTSQATPVKKGTYEAGTSAGLDVTFKAGPGRSSLVVSVQGEFGGGPREKSVVVAVGSPSPEQQKAQDEGVIVTPSGERLKKL